MLVIPFVLIMFVMSILAGVFGGGMETLFNGGRVQYNEETFHDYTNEQYRLEFADSAGFEDNLLIVFLIDEDYYDYHYIAWVGDHIATDINHMLGGNYTELGSAMSSCINDSCYKYSLDADLARVMEQLTKQIEELELESSFNCEEPRKEAQARLVNRTELPMTVETVENALREFTDTTGIPTVILVENMEAVFGKTMPVEAIVSVLVLGGIVILVNTCHCVAPSITAASSMERGIVSKYPLAIWKPRPVQAEYTMIRPIRIADPSVRPIAFKMKYCAIMVINPGNKPRIIARFI